MHEATTRGIHDPIMFMENMSQSPSGMMNDFSLFFGGFLVIFIIALLGIIFVSYILQGILYMKLAKKANLKHVWLAWIPYGPRYLDTLLAEISPMMMLIPFAVFSVIMMTDNLVFISLLGLVSVAYYIYCTRRIFERFEKNPDLAFFSLVPVIGELFVYIYYFILAFGESKYLPLKKDNPESEIINETNDYQI